MQNLPGKPDVVCVIIHCVYMQFSALVSAYECFEPRIYTTGQRMANE